MSKTTDSPRWCATHGDHHTDRCPLTYDLKTPHEHQWDMVHQQRKIMTGQDPKPYPGPNPPTTPRKDVESKVVSAQYAVVCPTCGAGPKKPCRFKITKRVTDTHRARIDAAYPNNP